ncbi:MAG: MinD/ParA family protein, partial [Spirochaeta sp.]
FIDLDLGGSNLHSALGVKNRHSGLGNFLSDRRLSFEQLLTDTPYSNLRFVPGDVLVAGTPNIGFAQKRSIISNIEKLDAEYVLLDLGSGANNNVVDFFLISNSGIIVTSPHVGAVLNAYSFLKNTVFRFLQRAFAGESEVERFLRKSIKERRPGNPVTVASVIEGMEKIDKKQAQRAGRFIRLMQPSLVLNLVRSSDDLNIAESLRDLTRKNLDVDLTALGFMIHDDHLAGSHRSHAPIVASIPDCLLAFEVDRIAQKIVQSPEFPTLPLEKEMYSDSYELMHIESTNDLAQLQQNQGPEPGQSQANAEEFIEILTAQKKQIRDLQNTVRRLSVRQQY